MEPMTQEAVQVEIFGQAYTLCGGGPDYIVMLAEYVDAKMRSIADENVTADNSQLAVLAAVRIADEYHRSQRDGCEEKMSQGESGEEMRLMTEADRQRTRETPTSSHAALVRAPVTRDRRGQVGHVGERVQGVHRPWQNPRLESALAVQDIT